MNGRTAINVVLPTDNTFLESVVVVGYGTQKKGSITGSVAGVGNDDIIKTKSENPQNMLTGRVPGLSMAEDSRTGYIQQRIRYPRHGYTSCNYRWSSARHG